MHTLNHEIAGKRGETAKLQLLVEKMAQAGDPVALGIYKQAAGELCLSIMAVARKLGFTQGAFKASYSGGLFNAGDYILQPMAQLLEKEGGSLAAPLYPPEMGAVMMAMRAHDPAVRFGEGFGD